MHLCTLHKNEPLLPSYHEATKQHPASTSHSGRDTYCLLVVVVLCVLSLLNQMMLHYMWTTMHFGHVKRMNDNNEECLGPNRYEKA